MKLKVCFLIVLCILLSGCGKNNYFYCKINVENNLEGYKLKGTYKITFKGNFVTYIEKKETYTSDDTDIISYFRQAKDLEYSNLLNNYGGVEYKVTNSERITQIEAKINVDKMDIKQLSKDGLIDKDYVTSNKISINGIKHIYEAKGAVCD